MTCECYVAESCARIVESQLLLSESKLQILLQRWARNQWLHHWRQEGCQNHQMTEKTLVSLTQIRMPRVRVCVGRIALNPVADVAGGIQTQHSAQLSSCTWSAEQKRERRPQSAVSTLRHWFPGTGAGVLTKGIRSQKKGSWSQSHKEAICQQEGASGRSDVGKMIPDIIAIRHMIGFAVERK